MSQQYRWKLRVELQPQQERETFHLEAASQKQAVAKLEALRVKLSSQPASLLTNLADFRLSKATSFRLVSAHRYHLELEG